MRLAGVRGIALAGVLGLCAAGCGPDRRGFHDPPVDTDAQGTDATTMDAVMDVAHTDARPTDTGAHDTGARDATPPRDSAPADTGSTPHCAPSCATDLDCQSTCGTFSGQVACCDVPTHSCYQTAGAVCPSPATDAGGPVGDAGPVMCTQFFSICATNNDCASCGGCCLAPFGFGFCVDPATGGDSCAMPADGGAPGDAGVPDAASDGGADDAASDTDGGAPSADV